MRVRWVVLVAALCEVCSSLCHTLLRWSSSTHHTSVSHTKLYKLRHNKLLSISSVTTSYLCTEQKITDLQDILGVTAWG